MGMDSNPDPNTKTNQKTQKNLAPNPNPNLRTQRNQFTNPNKNPKIFVFKKKS
jgi:hypothetical protein